MPPIRRTRLEHWRNQWGGIVIAKPRFGSYGVGIKIYTTAPPPMLPSVVGEEETLVQQFIKPPAGWGGISIRQLVQRLHDRRWVTKTMVMRSSKDDAIVNVSRGAKTHPAIDWLPTSAYNLIKQQSIQAANALAKCKNGKWLVELGIDFVIDNNWKPWLIEVNAQPKGKLRYLASKQPDLFGQERKDILAQPLKSLTFWLKNNKNC